MPVEEDGRLKCPKAAQMGGDLNRQERKTSELQI